MLIVCPSCETSYRVETACFREAGRLVRCVRCGDVWLGTQSLLVPAAVIENEPTEISAVEPPACEPDSLEPPAPDAAPDMEFEPAGAATEEQDDVLDAPEISPQTPDVAPRDLLTAPVPCLLRSDPAFFHASVAPVQIEAAPLQAYVIRPARRSRRRAPYLLIAVLALLAFNSALVGWRRAVVKIAPQTASLYRAVGLPIDSRGLAITNITTVAQLHEGAPLLLVEGTVASTSTRTVRVPRLRLSLRNTSGQEIYSWSAEPERRTLPPGESLTFHSRLASPPPEAHDVVVRFFNRDDMVEMQRTAAIRTARRADAQ
jgi:predicted Zn finger-like uncharacterized protein